MSTFMSLLAYILVSFITLFLVQRVEYLEERIEKIEVKKDEIGAE